MKTDLKKEEALDIIIIALILFANLVIESAKYLPYVCVIFAIALIYIILVLVKKPQIIKEMFLSDYFWWIIFFSIEMFLYGFFGKNKEEYSLKFHVLNVAWILMILIILQKNTGKIKDIMAKAGSIVIILMSMYILIINFNHVIDRDVDRIGKTAIGNVNTTAISYIFLLLPIFYKVGVEKSKKYIPIALVGIIFMLLTGSKKGIISLILSIIIIIMGKSKSKKEAIKNALIVVGVIAFIMFLCYCIPTLYRIIGARIESMMISILNFNMEDQSSTGLRLNFIITAFTKTWDKPIFGHGWGAFAPIYGYSSRYQTNLYTHNNYAEILFSFGLVGLFLYYWFPAKMTIRTIKNKNERNMNIFCWFYIINMLFIDFGTVSCYDTIIGFLSFSIVSLVLRDQKNRNILESKEVSTKIIEKGEKANANQEDSDNI